MPGDSWESGEIAVPMLGAGPAKKVSVYIGEDRSYHGKAAYLAIVEYLFHRGVAGATVVRGIAGFGADHHLHTVAIERLTENLPLNIQFIDSEERLEDLLPELYRMVGTGLIEIGDTEVAKPARLATRERSEQEQPLKRSSTAQFMRICVNERDVWRGRPLYQALVECLRANGVAGVTVYQGWLGSGENEPARIGGLFHSGRGRPMTLAVVENEDKLRAIIPVLDEMIPEGVLALSEVETIEYTHDFRSAERRKKPRIE